MSFFGGVVSSIKNAGKQTGTNIKSAAITPFKYTAQTVGTAVKAGAPVLDSVTGLLKANPALAGAIPGVGGFLPGLLGSGSAQSAPVGLGTADAQPAPPSGPSTLVYVVGAVAVLGLAYFFLRKR